MISNLDQPPTLSVNYQAKMSLDTHPAAVYLAGLNSESSRVSQGRALRKIAELLGAADVWSCSWEALRFQHVAAIRARLVGTYAPSTARRYLAALRGVMRAAFRLGMLSAEDYQRALLVDPIPGSPLLAGRALSGGEIMALMAACEADPGPAGRRDAAILAVFYPGGLRRAEVAALQVGDVDAQAGALTVRHGKRNKARIVPICEGARRALADWLSVRGDQPGALFWPINKAGVVSPGQLTPAAIRAILAKRAHEARIGCFSPHDLRRSVISDMLDKGADITTVARLVGHENVQTTARYDRRPFEARRKAAELLYLPYSGRGGL